MTFTRRLGFESLESRRLLATVDIPDNLTGHALEQVSTPVNIDTAVGIRAEIRATYNTAILDLSDADILAGSVWANDPTVDVVASVDDAAGTIVVSIFGGSFASNRRQFDRVPIHYSSGSCGGQYRNHRPNPSPTQ